MPTPSPGRGTLRILGSAVSAEERTGLLTCACTRESLLGQQRRHCDAAATKRNTIILRAVLWGEESPDFCRGGVVPPPHRRGYAGSLQKLHCAAAAPKRNTIFPEPSFGRGSLKLRDLSFVHIGAGGKFLPAALLAMRIAKRTVVILRLPAAASPSITT